MQKEAASGGVTRWYRGLHLLTNSILAFQNNPRPRVGSTVLWLETPALNGRAHPMGY